jgi:hypothetical protein
MQTPTAPSRRAGGRLAAGVAAAALLVAGALALSPSVASAARPRAAGVAAATCSATALSAAQAAAGRALSARDTRLDALVQAVGTAARLTATDRSTLTTDLDDERAGLEGLEQKVPTDTTCAEVAADAEAMVVDYRVYLVMSPQVHLAIAADAESAIVGQLQGLEPTISARIAAARARGVTVAAAQATFGDLEAQVAAAAHSSASIAASVLAATPASYPGCVQTFEQDRASLESGRTALRHAHADLKTLIADAR